MTVWLRDLSLNASLKELEAVKQQKEASDRQLESLQAASTKELEAVKQQKEASDRQLDASQADL